LNFFSKDFLACHRLKLLFFVIWLHVSALDLFYITYSGPVFMWQENMAFITLAVHFFIAFVTMGLYWLISQYIDNNTNKNN